jgi:hypothetical protein
LADLFKQKLATQARDGLVLAVLRKNNVQRARFFSRSIQEPDGLSMMRLKPPLVVTQF